MPFGAMFGAVVFGVLCLGWGGRLLGGSPSHGLVTILWAALGLVLPLGLLLRTAWARWLGIAAALLLAVVGMKLVLDRGDVGDHLVLLAAIVCGALLAVPATGGARTARATSAPARSWGSWTLAAATLGILVSLAFFSLPPMIGSAPPARAASAPRAGSVATPRASGASAPGASSVTWASFGSGARRAKSEGRPMFVDFYATWCGVCKMMDRQTFRDPAVIAALAEMVPVKVDSEDETPRDGFRGSDLAERHSIRGYPTLVLFDAEGHELSRRAGFLEPRAFLSWLDSSLRSRKAARASPQDALRAGR